MPTAPNVAPIVPMVEIQSWLVIHSKLTKLPKIFCQIIKQTNQIIHHLGLVFYVYPIPLMQNVLLKVKVWKLKDKNHTRMEWR